MIQTYDIKYGTGFLGTGMEKNPNGRFVLLADHLADKEAAVCLQTAIAAHERVQVTILQEQIAILEAKEKDGIQDRLDKSSQEEFSFLNEQIATLKVENLNLYEASRKTVEKQAEEIIDYEKVITAVKLDAARSHELVGRQAEEIERLWGILQHISESQWPCVYDIRKFVQDSLKEANNGQK